MTLGAILLTIYMLTVNQIPYRQAGPSQISRWDPFNKVYHCCSHKVHINHIQRFHMTN